MKFVELKKSLEKGKEPCYLLSGDDPFVLQSALKMFERAVELPEMNLIHLTAPTASEIVNAALVFPVMSPIRLIEVENFEKDSTDLKKYLSSPSPHSVIVIVSPIPTKNLSGLTGLTIVDCSRQSESIITAYIARECSGAGVSITVPAAKLLAESCNRYMTRISVELKKLISYKGSGVIESSDVSMLVSPDLEFKVYELGDSIASRSGEKAMSILSDMLESGSSAATFGMIYSHFRKLLYVSIVADDEQLKRYLGISDYPLKKLRAQAKDYTPLRLKRICDELHKVDYDYKAGLIGDKLAISTFALKIINEGK